MQGTREERPVAVVGGQNLHSRYRSWGAVLQQSEAGDLMSDLVRGKGKNLSRSKRVDRGSNLIIAAGGAALLFLVTFVLAIVGIIGGGVPLVALIVTAACGFGAYRTIRS
jgi:hypothetical protein